MKRMSFLYWMVLWFFAFGTVSAMADEPPTGSLSAPLDGAISTTRTPTFMFTGDDPEDNHAYCYLYIGAEGDNPFWDPMDGYPVYMLDAEGETYSNWKLPDDMALANGTYKWGIRVFDGYWSIYVGPRTLHVNVVNNSPDITLQLPPNWSETTDQTPTFKFYVSDQDGDRVDCNIFISNSCSPPTNCPISGYPKYVGYVNGSGTLYFTPPSNLPPDIYEWQIVADDGTVSQPSTAWVVTITAQNEPPWVNDLVPPNNTHTTDPTPTFGFEAGDPECVKAECYLYVSNNTDPFTSPLANFPVYITNTYCGQSIWWDLPGSYALAPGHYYWGIQVRDGVHTVNSNVLSLYIDATNHAPEITLQLPPNWSQTENPRPTFTCSVYDQDWDQVYCQIYISNSCSPPYTCPLPGYPKFVAWVEGSGTPSFTPPEDLQPDVYEWQIKAFDGTVEVFSTAWVVEILEPNQPPTLNAILPTDGFQTTNNTALFGYELLDLDCNLSSCQLYVASLGNNPFTSSLPGYPIEMPCMPCGGSFEQPVYIPNGNYSWAMRATDAGGLTAESEVRNLYVETNTAPIISVEDITVEEGELFTLQITANDDSGIEGFDLDLDDDGLYEESFGPEGITTRCSEIGLYQPRVKLRANDGGRAETTFELVVEVSADELFPPDGPSEVLNFGKVQLYGYATTEMMYNLPDAAYTALTSTVDDLDEIASHPENWKTYTKHPDSKQLFIGKSKRPIWSDNHFSIVKLNVHHLDIGSSNETYDFLLIIEDKFTGNQFHFHGPNAMDVKPPNAQQGEYLLPYTKLDNYLEEDLVINKVGIINKQGSNIMMFTDLPSKDPGMWTGSNRLHNWRTLLNPNNTDDRVFNVFGMVKADKTPITTIGDLKSALKKAFTVDRYVVVVDATTPVKSSKVLKYLHGKSGKVFRHLGVAISILDIGWSIYNRDWEGAFCKGVGEGVALVTVVGFTLVSAGVCSECVVTAEALPICASACLGVSLGLAYVAYERAESFCLDHVVIEMPNGETVELDQSDFYEIEYELDRIGYGNAAQVAIETSDCSGSKISLSEDPTLITLYDEFGNPIVVDENSVLWSSYQTSDGKLHEVITILNPPNGVYTAHINTGGVDPDSTFTLTFSAQTYDTLAAGVRFADVPEEGYATDVDVNQKPQAILGLMQGDGSVEELDDTTIVRVDTTVTFSAFLSYDPDGDSLQDFSVDFYADNEWEFNQIPIFMQRILWTFDTTGIYPVVLRVRDQYQLSGFDTIWIDVQLVVAVDDEETVILPKFKLMQNYPNPFNPTTIIEYSLPRTTDVQLEVFNLLGQKVATLIDGVQEPGRHRVEWQTTQQSSGIYFYRLKTQEATETKKMLILK